MTRKEEIERASKIRADQYSHPVDWNKCYHHFKEGAEFADKTMIEKACKWLESYFSSHYNSLGLLNREREEIITDFRKAMGE